MLTVQRLSVTVPAAIVLITALYVRKITIRLSSKTQMDNTALCAYSIIVESMDQVLIAKQKVLIIVSAQDLEHLVQNNILIAFNVNQVTSLNGLRYVPQRVMVFV